MLGFLILPQVKPADTKTSDNESEREDEEYRNAQLESDETLDTGCRS